MPLRHWLHTIGADKGLGMNLKISADWVLLETIRHFSTEGRINDPGLRSFNTHKLTKICRDMTGP
jgi:hypothetical protein